MMPQADNTHALPANLPQLRFPEFKDAGAWEVKPVNKWLTIGSGKDYKHLSTGNVPVYGTGGYMLSVNEYLYDGESVCIGRKGTIDKPMFLSGKFWTVDTLFYTHSFVNCLPKFIYSCFQNIEWSNYNEASGVPSLSKVTIGQIEIAVPSLPEQQKIAACLSSLDDLITAENQQLEALKTHKKGLMQSLFPAEGETVPKHRFPEFKDAGAWSKKPIGAIGNFLGGGTPSKSNESFWKGNVPWISSSDISEDSIHKINITRFISDEALKESATKLVPENSILVVSRVGVGKLAITRSSVCTSQDFINLTPYADDIEFLGYLLKANGGDLESLGQGMAIKGFTKEDFSKYEIYLPSLGEQQKISACLSSLDDLISAHSQKIEALKQHKKGLMQQLFPFGDKR